MSTVQVKTNTSQSIIIIGALFFVFGFITWSNSVLIPYLKIACELNNFESYLVTFCFYISYLVMAKPSTMVLHKTGLKKGMGAGLLLMAVGALIFIPAALSRTYLLFLLGLFVQGAGLAILQTASNPYITILGPLESAAKRISIMGICNKVAGIIAPLVLGSIMLSNADDLTATLNSMSASVKEAELDMLASKVIMPYAIICVVLFVLVVFIYKSSLPEIDTDNEDESVARANSGKTSVFQFPHLVMGVITLFLYVGVEVIAGDTIISYGAAQGIPFTEAKNFTGFTLASMIAGYLIGIVAIPKYLKQNQALVISAGLGVVFTLLALFTTGYTSVLCVALLGLANALMWPSIWPLALAGLGRFTKIGSSLLITGIAGGAIIPLLYGRLADVFNAQQAYWVALPCYLFIGYYALTGHKMGRNIFVR